MFERYPCNNCKFELKEQYKEDFDGIELCYKCKRIEENEKLNLDIAEQELWFLGIKTE